MEFVLVQVDIISILSIKSVLLAVRCLTALPVHQAVIALLVRQVILSTPPHSFACINLAKLPIATPAIHQTILFAPHAIQDTLLRVTILNVR
jgi:hypothetical protein